MPKQSVFVRDRTPPKASVVITPHSGRSVSANQVQALVHLVASSVPLMTPENVAVVDNQGKLITDSSSAAILGLTSAESQHKQKIEDLYRQRVMQILSPIVGDNNVRSQVNMSLDFTQTEVTTEDFDTRGKGPKTRSEAVSEDNNSAMEAAGILAHCQTRHRQRHQLPPIHQLQLQLVLAVVQVAKPPEVLATLKLTALFATLKMQPVQLSV